MRKFLSVIMAFAMFLAVVPTSFSVNGVSLSCEDAEAAPGDDIQIPVNVTSDTGFMYLSITPEYDHEVFTVTAQNGNFISDFTKGNQLIWASDDDFSGSGLLCTLGVKVSETAPESEAASRA